MNPRCFEIDFPASSFETALQNVKGALADEGFGVLTEVDVSAVFAEKLGATFPSYVILGACAPELAYRALQHEPLSGLALPCTVVIRANGPNRVSVAIASPSERFEAVGNSLLEEIAEEADQRIRRVVSALETAPLIAHIGSDVQC